MAASFYGVDKGLAARGSGETAFFAPTIFACSKGSRPGVNENFVGCDGQIGACFLSPRAWVHKFRSPLAGTSGLDCRKLVGKLADSSYELVVIRPALDLFDLVAESYRLLKPNGLLIIDQVLSGGKVADSTQRDPESISRRDVIKVIKEDERWLATVIPIGAGLLVANKLP